MLSPPKARNAYINEEGRDKACAERGLLGRVVSWGTIGDPHKQSFQVTAENEGEGPGEEEKVGKTWEKRGLELLE